MTSLRVPVDTDDNSEVAAHVRVRDKVVDALPAAALLTTFAAMTAKGPDSPH